MNTQSEQYIFHDFSNARSQGKHKLERDECSMLKSDGAFSFNQAVSKEALDKGLQCLMVREDVFTGQIHLILNKDKGLHLTYTGVSRE